MFASSVEVFRQLKKLFPQIPDKVMKLTLTIESGKTVEMTVTYYPEHDPHFVHETRFELVEKKQVN